MGAAFVDVTYAQLDDAQLQPWRQTVNSTCFGCSIFFVVGRSRPKKTTTLCWAG